MAVILSNALKLSGIGELSNSPEQQWSMAVPCRPGSQPEHVSTEFVTGLRHQAITSLPVVTLANTSAEIQFLERYIVVKAYSRRRVPIVKPLIDISLHDLAVMLGTGSFTGALVSVLWNAFSTAPAPSQMLVATTLAGFLGGRLLSHYSERAKNDA